VDDGGTQGSPEEQVGFALGFLDGLITGAPDVVAGNLPGAFGRAARVPFSAPGGFGRSQCFDDDVCDDVTASYDEGLGAWTASCGAEGADCHLAFDFLVQYLDGAGAPQSTPDETTDQIMAETVISAGFTDPDRGAVAMDYADAMRIHDLRTSTYTAEGSGSMTGSAGDETFSMTWSYRLRMPAGGGCPSGTVELEFGSYSATATYSGSDGVRVVISQGSTAVHEETRPSECDRPFLDDLATFDAIWILNNLNLQTSIAESLLPAVPARAGELTFDGVRAAPWPKRWARGDDCVSACWPATFSWSEDEGAYVYRCEGTDGTCEFYRIALLAHLVTAAGAPQTQANGMTAHANVDLEESIKYLVNLGSFEEPEWAWFSFDVVSDLDLDTTQDPYVMTGSGTMDAAILAVGGEQVLQSRKTSWVADLTLSPRGGCSQGTIDMKLGRYDALMSYVGNTISLEVTRGTRIVFSDGYSFDCQR
jgi:hypothetical protein